MSAKTWNRSITALESYYGWACEQKLIAATPFRYKQRSAWLAAEREDQNASRPAASERDRHSGMTNAARVSTNPTPEIIHVSLLEYRFFRDHGLGPTSDDEDLPTAQRNRAFGDLLVTTGLRVQEGASLLLQEVPSPASVRALPSGESYVHRLATECAKGKKSRKIYMHAGVLEQFQEYIDVERADTVARAAARGVYGEQGWYRVRYVPSRKMYVGRDDAGEPWNGKLDVLDPVTRRRLLVEDDQGAVQPACLLLSVNTGRPVEGDWDGIFRLARERCAKYGRDLLITPHVLRHTFAVHTLSRLIRGNIEMLEALKDARPGDKIYHQLFGDALQILVGLLGHVSQATTMQYLRCVRESQELVNNAVQDLAATVLGGRYADDLEDDA